ncbi:MAG TPA: hypothetical protein VMU84_06215, partial [Thermoanaerobaculia bacterium]|nr:hypothetical protein [Thermoanaerobaculia bacterium]
VDIDHGTVAVWPFAAPSGDKHVVYVDLDALRAQGNKPWTISDGKAASAFFAHYAPKAGRYHTFEWVFRQPAAPQSAAFELKLYRKGDPVDKPVAYVHQWATLCPPQSPPPSTSSTAQ